VSIDRLLAAWEGFADGYKRGVQHGIDHERGVH
jgi:hypothetical protein